jgi:predicted nucleic acid-binding protein
MTIVVDANILISAIINPDSFIGTTLLIQNANVDYVLPSFAIEEALIHKERICKTLQIDESVFDNNLNAFNNNCLVFSSEAILPKYSKVAIQIVKKIDPKDAIYVAFSLALDALIWTGDLKLYKALRKKGLQKYYYYHRFKKDIKRYLILYI